MSDINDEAERRAREYVGGDLDWSIPESMWGTAPQRAHFRAGFLSGVERQEQRVAELEKQLATAVERADYAWRNTRLIDAARMEVEKKLADVLAIQSGPTSEVSRRPLKAGGRLDRSVMPLRIVPCDLKTANEFVRRLHRHSRPVVGHRFAVGVADDTGTLRGVAIVGRPVAPRLDDGKAAEITRLCTDGTRNACSMLYGAARKAARAMGHEPIYTYTLPEEGGASLRAAGFRLDKEDAGGSAAMWHSRPGRTAQPVGDDLVGGKWRWIG